MKALKIFIVCLLLLGIARTVRQSAMAGISDVFKSDGKKNDDWFAANNSKITGQFTQLGSIVVTNNMDQPQKLEALKGWVENQSDKQLSAVVFDVVVTQPGTGLEALRERVWLCQTVFKTEKANFALAQESPGIQGSQISECLRRNTNYNWTGVLVTAIPASPDMDIFKLETYYKVKSIWCRSK